MKGISSSRFPEISNFNGFQIPIYPLSILPILGREFEV
jgi:hypothetical protein